MSHLCGVLQSLMARKCKNIKTWCKHMTIISLMFQRRFVTKQWWRADSPFPICWRACLTSKAWDPWPWLEETQFRLTWFMDKEEKQREEEKKRETGRERQKWRQRQGQKGNGERAGESGWTWSCSVGGGGHTHGRRHPVHHLDPAEHALEGKPGVEWENPTDPCIFFAVRKGLQITVQMLRWLEVSLRGSVVLNMGTVGHTKKNLWWNILNIGNKISLFWGKITLGWKIKSSFEVLCHYSPGTISKVQPAASLLYFR